MDVTNDGFTGLGTLRRPKSGDTLPVAANAYHAGTELNPEDLWYRLARVAVISACRGAGDGGMLTGILERIGGLRLAPGAWLACFESTRIYDSYGVVQRKGSPKETTGRVRRFWAVMLGREVVNS